MTHWWIWAAECNRNCSNGLLNLHKIACQILSEECFLRGNFSKLDKCGRRCGVTECALNYSTPPLDELKLADGSLKQRGRNPVEFAGNLVWQVTVVRTISNLLAQKFMLRTSGCMHNCDWDVGWFVLATLVNPEFREFQSNLQKRCEGVMRHTRQRDHTHQEVINIYILLIWCSKFID